MNSTIVFEDVTKQFGSKPVLSGLNFRAEEGSFVGLIGNNGSGKTTTIRILCNLIPKNAGYVRIFGRIILPGDNQFKNRLGILLSEPYYIPDLDLVEYLKFVCRFQKVERIEANRRIKDLGLLLDLQDYAGIPIKKLSSGNQMKVSLAAALIHNPSVLVLDEPFVNLDIQTTQLLMKILLGFKGKKTVFITSHNLDLITELCDEFLILDHGKIDLNIRKEEFGTIKELKQRVKSKLTQRNPETNLDWLS